MPLAGFDPAVPAIEWPQAYAFNRTHNVIDKTNIEAWNIL